MLLSSNTVRHATKKEADPAENQSGSERRGEGRKERRQQNGKQRHVTFLGKDKRKEVSGVGRKILLRFANCSILARHNGL